MNDMAPDFDSQEQLEVAPGFTVTDEESANWVVRKITEARAYQEKVREWAKKEQDRAAADAEWFLGRFGAQLAEFTEKHLSGKKKSLSLPAGVVGFRKAPAQVQVVDEPALLEWAKAEAPEIVVVVPATERVSKSEINLWVKSTGEVPPGAIVVPEEERFYVK